MTVVYLIVILSIFVRSPMDLKLPGLKINGSENMTARFTGLSSSTFTSNLYGINFKQ
jgi:hypothetical protein